MPAETSGPSSPQLHIDWTRCDGHGACADLLPELLASDEWGYPIARPGAAGAARGDVAVPRELEDLARAAVTACPLMALRLRT